MKLHQNSAFWTFVLGMCCLTTPIITAATQMAEADAAVDSYVRAEMTKRQIPGLALAVIQADRILKLTAYGNANLEFGTGVSVDTLFSVASVSKAVTGVGIMRLVEDGRIRLDAPVAAYLPEIPVTWRAITVRQLLNHTSGLPVIDVDEYSTRTRAQTVPAAIAYLRGIAPPSPWA